ncbi:hypothetical protein [Actinacidiphila yeochonensis]|uniref:hypothetical protein n=1 Tax=Actinacidiphila yeochonensis TaxID=89050 RepID=UPI0006900F36|nr:hypothetical protein [Actinacidiphila yeochonensis]
MSVGYVVVLLIAMLPGILLIAAGSDDAGAALTVLGAIVGSACVIWLWVLLSLAPPALVLERQKVFAALKRSAKLVRGAWWRVLGIQILALSWPSWPRPWLSSPSRASPPGSPATVC